MYINQYQGKYNSSIYHGAFREVMRVYPQIQGHGDGKTHHFWLVVSTYPSEKSWSEFVSWDDDIPKIWKNHPNHQADIYIYNILHTGYIWIPGILDMILDICSDHTDHPIWDASMATCWSFPSMKPVLLTSSLPYVLPALC